MQILLYSIFYRFAHINTCGSIFVFFYISHVKNYELCETPHYLQAYVSASQRLLVALDVKTIGQRQRILLSQ